MLIPEISSGINIIPEENRKNFRYCINIRENFGYNLIIITGDNEGKIWNVN